jgi:hypothetical protein
VSRIPNVDTKSTGKIPWGQRGKKAHGIVPVVNRKALVPEPIVYSSGVSRIVYTKHPFFSACLCQKYHFQ